MQEKYLSVAIVLALCFSASVKTEDDCDCACSELKQFKTVCEALFKIDKQIAYVVEKVEERSQDFHILQNIKERVCIIEENLNLQTGRSPKALDEQRDENLNLKITNMPLCQRRMEMICENFENIAYKNETKKLNSGLSNLTTEILDLRNSTAPSKVVQDLENMDSIIRRMNETIIEGVSEITQLRMRLENIENKTKQQIEDLVTRVNHSIELTENTKIDISNEIRNAIADVRAEVKDSLSSTKRKTELLLNDRNKRIQELEKQVNTLLQRSVPPPPVIVNITSNSSYVAWEGLGTILICESKTSNFLDKLEWFIDEMNITDMSTQTNRFEEQISRSWLATSVLGYVFRREHNGKMLMCLATLTDHHEIHTRVAYVSLEIMYKPELRLSGEPKGTITEGDRVVIRCIVDAYPEAFVIWKKSGEIYSSGEELSFTSVKQSDSGIYTCVASNRIGKSLEHEVHIAVQPELCKLPSLSDPNMLVASEIDDKGNEMLVFGCQPLGKFVLIGPKKIWQCVGKQWLGTLPVCQKLLEPTEVKDLADQLYRESFCESGSGDQADPTDCTAFFSCVSGKLHRKKCSGFFGEFNSVTLSCVRFRYFACPKDTSAETSRLRDFIPAIHVIPDKVNKENSRMATDDVGSLVVYKGKSFKLSCSYPDNRWGPAAWTVDYFDSEAEKNPITTRKDDNQVIVDINSASETDSGIYTCRTPFGKFHSITVLVRVVKCVVPESAFLRTSGRVKDLTFSIRYQCEIGIEMKAFCKANGEWSKPPPTDEECSM